MLLTCNLKSRTYPGVAPNPLIKKVMLANLLIIEFQFDKYQQAEKDEKKALHTREVNSNHSY